uniref:Transmembrane protein 192 n=1 Tax=Parascaris univalens TaxID=6257 RepID=A0A915A766_PARUN
MLMHSPSFSNVPDEGAVAGDTISKGGTDETQQANNFTLFSTQLSSNPLHHKLTIVPKRDLVAGPFMFTVVCAGGICALCLLTHQSSRASQDYFPQRLDWYLQRQRTIESVVSYTLPRVNDLHSVAKRIANLLLMLNMLSLFVAEEYRRSCLKTYVHFHSPYLRLQVVCRIQKQRQEAAAILHQDIDASEQFISTSMKLLV